MITSLALVFALQVAGETAASPSTALSVQEEAPQTRTLRGRVILPENLPKTERYLVVTTGEGVTEPAHARPDENGNFELRVEANGDPIGLDLHSRHLYLNGAILVDSDSEGEIRVEPDLGARMIVRVSRKGGWDMGRLADAGIVIHALQGDKVIRRGYLRKNDRPRPNTPTYELRGLPSGADLRIRVRTKEFPELISEIPAKWDAWEGEEGDPFLPPGSTYQLAMHVNHGVRLMGQVVDEKGEGVPAASLKLALPDRWGYFGPTWFPHPLDEEGRFDLLWRAEGKVRVALGGEGFAPEQLEIGPFLDGEEHADLEWRMEHLPAIEGRLLRPDGTPAEGATVFYQCDAISPPWGRGLGQPVEVAQNGGFVLAGTKKDETYRLYAALYDGERLYQLERGGLSANEKDLVLALTPQFTLAGRVLDPEGEPIPRFVVHGYMSGLSDSAIYRSVEDERGRFELPGLGQSSWELRVSATGYVTSPNWPIEPGAKLETKDIVLIPSARLHCRVIAPDGRPLPKGGVTLVRVQPGKAFDWHRDLRSREREKEPSEDGETIFSPVSPGTYCLVGGAKGFAHSRLMEIELRPGEVRRGVALQVQRPAKLAGRFHPEGKFPITGDVELRSLEVGIVRETRLDATRSFVFEGLAPGQYQLTSEKREGRPHFSGLIEIVEGEDRELLFGNPENDRYTFTLVVTRGGEPLVGAPCRILTSRDGQELSALTDEEGKARFQPAVRDFVDIFVGLENPGYEVPFTWWIPPAEDYVPITRLFPGQPNPILELDVPEGILRGRVVFADGQPASAVTVGIDAPHGFKRLKPRREGLTGPSGEFIFAGIPSGSCKVYVTFELDRRRGFKRFEALEVLGGDPDPCEHELRLDSSR